MSEQNKTIARSIIDDIWNDKNPEKIPEIYSANYVMQSSEGEIRGPDGYAELYQRYMSAFPDGHFHIENIVAEGDDVVLAYTFHGTNTGAFADIPATGREVRVQGTTMLKVADGQVVEERAIWDRGAMMEQMGLIPE